MNKYQAIDSKHRVWSHQYGNMWTNESYEVKTTRFGKNVTDNVQAGRIIRHERDIRWLSTVD